jgi:hypothetical protein
MSKAADLANLIGNINAGGGGVNRNLIINGAMNVAQRGTSATGLGGSAGYFTCDRWKLDFTSSGRLTMTQDSSAPSGFANSIKLACTTADTSIANDEFLILNQAFEGQNLQILDKGLATAKAFNVSFYVKASGVFTFGLEFYDADNGRHNCRTFATTTDWVRHSFTIQADVDDGSSPFDDDNAASLYLNFWLHGGANSTSGTLATNWANFTAANRAVGISSFYSSTDNEFFITGVQVEVGQNPTEFEHEPFERTLQRCRRYYHKIDSSDSIYQRVAQGQAYTNDDATVYIHLFPEMRGVPTLDYGTLSNLGVGTSNFTAKSIGSLSIDSNTDGANTCTLNAFDIADDALSAGDVVQMFGNNSTDAYIAFKAEL